MQLALTQASIAASKGEVPVGAVLVRDQQLIASAHNHPIELNDPTAHAEILVLRQAAKIIENYRLINTTIYVTLEPCVMCAGALIHARVSRIVFGAFDPKTGAAGSVYDILSNPRLNHKPECIGGICAEESKMLLQSFFAARR